MEVVLKRLLIGFIIWLALFILSIKSFKIADRKYKETYQLKRIFKFGFLKVLFICHDRNSGEVTWYVAIMNLVFYAFNIIFGSLLIYTVYKLAWGVELPGYAAAVLTFALFQFLIPIACIAFDFFYDIKTEKTRFPEVKTPEYEEEEEKEDYYESNT